MKNWTIWLLSLAAAAALFGALLAFSQQKAPAGVSLNIAIPAVVKSKVQPIDFWTVVADGMQEASREFGVPVKLYGPPFERDIEKQIEILNDIIDAKPPIIILAAADYKRLAEPVARASSLGIPVVTLDSGVDSEVPVCFIATNNVEAGRKAGDEARRLLAERPGKKVAIVSHLRETATGIEREAGVREALAGIDIVGTWYCDVDRGKARNVSLELLVRPEIGAIVALNETVTLGVADAIVETGSKDRVVVVGFDNAPEELAFLEQGVIKATVVQRPFDMGYLSVKTAWEHLNGHRVPKNIDTGSLLVTAEKMFLRGYQEILFPFTSGSSE